MDIVNIEITKISLPSSAQEKSYPDEVIAQMAEEIKQLGWPKGKELGVKPVNNGFEVNVSFAWFKAGVLSGIKMIPCVIY
jgi:hypothetical protein